MMRPVFLALFTVLCVEACGFAPQVPGQQTTQSQAVHQSVTMADKPSSKETDSWSKEAPAQSFGCDWDSPDSNCVSYNQGSEQTYYVGDDWVMGAEQLASGDCSWNSNEVCQ